MPDVFDSIVEPVGKPDVFDQAEANGIGHEKAQEGAKVGPAGGDVFDQIGAEATKGDVFDQADKLVQRSSKGEGLFENLRLPSLSDVLYPGRVIAGKAGAAMRGVLDTSDIPPRAALKLTDFMAERAGWKHEEVAPGESTLTAPTLYEEITRPVRRWLGGTSQELGKVLERPTEAVQQENQARLSAAMEAGGLPLKAAEQVGQVATSLLVDLVGFKAAGIGGAGGAARDILRESGKAAAYVFATTPGDEATKAKAAAMTAAFFATPIVSNKMPTDAAAIAVSTLLNAGVTTAADLPRVRGVVRDSIAEAKAAGREGDWWKYTLTNLIPVYGPDLVFGLMAKSTKAANDPTRLKLATPDVLHDNLVELFGADKVKRAQDGSSVQVSLPDGRKVAYEFVGDEAGLRQKDPAAFFRSVRASKDPRDAKLAEDMLADANGDQAAAGRALRDVFEAVAVTQRNVLVRDVATGERVNADVLVQLVAGKAKIGDLKEEDLHAVVKLAGLEEAGGKIKDPKTGRTLDEEGLARALNEGTQHPVAQKVRDLALRVTNLFRRDPQESLFQTASRLRGDLADEAGARALDARAVDRGAEGASVVPMRGKVAAVADEPAGPAWQAVTPKGEATVRGEWRVVDAGELVTSQDKGYDQALQPRNRDTAASLEQIASIRQSPRPAELMDLPTTDGGAPIVTRDGQVISGNGRTLGLRGAYDAATANAYREQVLAKAAELGVPVDPNMRRPVLVRVLSDSGGLGLDRLAELSNQPKILMRSAAEQAEADGRLLTDSGLIEKFNPDASGSIRAASNNDFLVGFIQGSGSAELRTSNGNFDPAIDGRVRRAVLAAVLGKDPQSRALVQDLVERADALGVQRQRDGVMAAGGRLVKLGRAKPEYDVTGDVAQALRDLVRYQRDRQEGLVKTLDDYLAQQEMFGTGRTDGSLLLLKALVENPGIGATRGLLERYVAKAERIDTSTPDMFGEQSATALDLLRRAFNERELAEADAGAVGAGPVAGAGERASARRRENEAAARDGEGARGGVGSAEGKAGPAGRQVVPAIGSEGRPEFQGLEERLATRRREFDADGRPMRGTALRVVNSDEFKAIAEDIRANPEAYYDPQSHAAIRERTGKLSDAELDAKLGPLDRLSAEAGKDNDLMASAAEKVMRLHARGDSAGARAAVLAMAKNATTVAQLLRQAALLKTSTPEGMVGMVDALHEQRTGKPLPDAERKVLTGAADADIKATGRVLEAEEAFRNKPTAKNAEELDAAAAANAKAKRAWIARSAESLPKDWADMIRLLMQGNALTSSSIIANTVGNTVNFPLRFVGRTIGATTEGVLNALGLVKTRTLGQPLADTWAYVRGTGKALGQTGATLRTGVNLQDIMAGGEVARGFQPYRAWIRQFSGGKSVNDRLKLLVEGTAGVPAEAVFRMLSVTDAPFYGGAYESALHEIGRLRGLDGKKLEQFMKVPDATSKALAEERARDAVYQGDKSALTKLVVAASGAIGNRQNGSALERVAAELVLRPVLLFSKTPANVISEAHKFLNPVYSAYDIARQRSLGNQREAFQAFGRMATGMMIWSAVDAIVKAGLAAGTVDNERERALAQATLKPLHVNVSGLKRLMAGKDPSYQPGDEQWDYRNLGIFGLALNIAATREENLRNDAWSRRESYSPEDASKLERALATTTGLPAALLNASMMKGTASLLEGITRKDPWSWLGQWFETVSGVALPNTLRQVARYKFEEMPETKAQALDNSESAAAEAAARSVVNGIKVKMAGAQALFGPRRVRIEDLPVRVDLLGRTVKNTPAGSNPITFNFVDTRKPEQIPSDKYAQEVRRVYLATGVREVIPSVPDATLTANGQKIRLNEQQLARLKQIQGTFYLWGMDDVMRSPAWVSWNDVQRAAYYRVLNLRSAEAAKWAMLQEMYGPSGGRN